MKLFKSLVANTSSQLILRIISSATGFFITLLVARHFGLAGYSDLAKITALVGLFYLGIDLGANAIFLQLEKNSHNFHNLLFSRLLLALVLFCVICAIVFALPYNQTTTSGYSLIVKFGILFFSLTFFTKAIIYSTSAVFQQNLVYKNAAKAGILGSLITLGVVGVTVALNMPLLWVIGAYVAGSVFESTLSLHLARYEFSFSLPSFTFVKNLFFLTLPITILLFLNLLYFRVDMILLTFFQKASAVGIYDYAYKYYDFLIALPLFLSNSLYPHLLQQEKNFRIQRKNISLYTALFFCLGIVLVPFVWLGAPLIALVKTEFSASVVPLRLLTLSLPIFFATNILQWIFITKKKQTILVGVYAVSLVLNIVLNIIFIPTYSYVASAVITGFSELLILLIMIILLFTL